MGNYNSNQLIKDQDLSISLVEKEAKLAEDPQNITDVQQKTTNSEIKENSETKENIKKGKKKKLDDMILDQKDLLPQQFSSLKELQKKYLDEKEKKKKSLIESSEWDLTVSEVEEITCLAITNDDKFLISTTQTGLITVFDLENKKPVHHFPDWWKEKITSIVVSEDNEVFVARKYGVELFDLTTKKEISRYTNYDAYILSVLLSKDKKQAVVGQDDGSIRIFDLSNQKEIHCMKSIHQGPIYSMAFSHDYLYFVTGSGDGSVKIFDFNTRSEAHDFPIVHKGAITCLNISPNDNYIITGSADHSIKVFNLKTKQELYHFEEAHEDEITSVIVSKDNKNIYSASKDLSIKVFDLETKQEISRFENIHKSRGFEFSSFTLISVQITSIVLSNSQRYLFSGSVDGSIMMFDLDNQQKIYLEDVPHEDRVDMVAISHNNNYIISASNGYIKVFDFHLKKEKPQLLRCGESKTFYDQDLFLKEF